MPIAYPIPSIKTPFRDPLIKRFPICLDSDQAKLVRRTFKAAPCAEPSDLDLRISWSDITSGQRHNTWIAGPDGFALVVIDRIGQAALVQRLEGHEREPQPQDVCRLHPIELRLNRSLRERGKETGMRIGIEDVDGVPSFVLSGPANPQIFVPFKGPDNPKLKSIDAARRQRVADALSAEVAAWAAIAERARQENRGNDARWPAPLCRIMTHDLASIAELQNVLQQVVHYVADRLHYKDPFAAHLHLDGPRQDGQETTIRLVFRNDFINDDPEFVAATNRMQELSNELFHHEMTRLWPDGIITTRGPGPAKGLRSAAAAIQNISILSSEPPSNHQRLLSMVRLKPIADAIAADIAP